MEWKNALPRRLVLPAVGLIGLALFVMQVRSMRAGADQVPTPVSATSAPIERVLAEGRLVAYPGAEVTVGTEVGGFVTRVLVAERTTVRKGELLAEFRADDLRAELSMARARVAEAEADTTLYRSEYARIRGLLAAEVETEANLDRARRNLEAAIARLQVAEASIARLEAEIEKTRILAPIDGVVLDRAVDPGETVTSESTIFIIADLERTRIEAEVDEFDVGRLALGSPVRISAEGFTGFSWQGRVEEIPDRVVPRRTKPQDPGKPGDTRVLLVKIAITEPTPLKLGQRVEVEIARDATRG